MTMCESHGSTPQGAAGRGRMGVWLRRTCRAALGALTSMILVSGCAHSANVRHPILDIAVMQGTWKSSDGATLRISASGTFSASRINFPEFVGMDSATACGNTGSGVGTWAFISANGSFLAGARARSDSVEFDFTSISSARSYCRPGGEYYSWQVGSRLQICLDMDPDDPCSTGYFFTKG